MTDCPQKGLMLTTTSGKVSQEITSMKMPVIKQVLLSQLALTLSLLMCDLVHTHTLGHTLYMPFIM